MTLNELDILLRQPQQIQESDSPQLKQLIEKYPYFQSVRSLYLKSLYVQESTEYNLELKKTAAHTLDRDILFDFIVSPEFATYIPIAIEIAEPAAAEEAEIPTEEEPQQEAPKPKLTSTAIKSLLQSITFHETDDKEEIQDPVEETPTEVVIKSEEVIAEDPIVTTLEEKETVQQEIEKLEEKLEIGKPLNFSENEKLSFQEWLQLSKIKPIDRENDSILTDLEQKSDIEKQKKIELIDKFIETNPKIVPTKKPTVTPANIDTSVQENSSLMTETLAKIYLEQKKYQKAIQAYEILILKYPEKSSFFANQILDIKALQQHNS
ncbi:tetratricopeptide repeat protein [Myroides odoratimimus]|uniref:tetratricopeptide repeat protein n=1 Tax=Myroides odoratimimus TaxID=76832 RepID=UPI000469C318|nr:tetratricopeptide repeat protein [Myroides odoratimimus]